MWSVKKLANVNATWVSPPAFRIRILSGLSPFMESGTFGSVDGHFTNEAEVIFL